MVFFGGSINSPWSPDGTKLIFSQNIINDEKHQFYVLDVATKNIVLLTKEPGEYYSPSWSPDGEHIAFTSNETQGNQAVFFQLYIVDNEGTQLTNVTAGLPDHASASLADYYWSPDGTSITFVTSPHAGKSQSIVYKAGLDGSLVPLTSTNQQLLDWWNGIILQADVPERVEETAWSFVRADGSQTSIGTCQSKDLPAAYALKRSADGTLAFGVKCSSSGWMLYGANSEGTTVNKLLSSPLDARYDSLFHMTWSPDDHFLAFMALDEEHYEYTDLFIVNAKDPSVQPLKMENSSSPSWQPVVNQNLVEEPTPRPTETVSASGLIAFTAVGENGSMDIFTVHPDGSGLANLTNDPAIESNIAWSPDGTKLAFVSDRDGNDDIFVMNADGTNQIRITDDPASDLAPLWSPDGQRIAYTLNDLDKKISNLFVVDSNGQSRRRLTDHDKSPDMMGVWAEEWSSDGNYIFYLDQALISKVNTQSGEITKVSPEADWPAYLLAKDDGSRIRFLSPCSRDSGEFCSKVMAIGEDGAGEETYGTMQLQQVCTSGEPGLHYSQVKWSPDLTKIMVVFNCSRDGGVFYIANADGSDFKPLTSYSLPIGAIGFNNYVSFDWSPDSQSIIFTSSPDDPQTQVLSILSVKDALKNPELHSTQLSLSTSQASNLAWQPAATKPLVKEDPTPKPAETVSASELIAFTAIDKTGNTDIFTVHPDGRGLVNLTNNPTLEANLAWSPDGTRLAFVSDQNINVMNADGSDLKSLTNVPGTYAGLLWSPDGTKIAYTLRDLDGKTANIYVLDSNGGNQHRLTDRHPGPDNIWVWSAAWSPDGQYIYYSDYLAPGQAHIIKLNAESGESTIITGNMFDLPSFIVINKDGSIVYLVNCTENAADFCLKVKSVNQDGTGDETHETMQIQQLCSSKYRVSSFYFGAKWSPDRTKIIFAIECPDSGVRIYTANADGSDFKPVTDPDPFPYKDIRFNWSSDSQSIAFIDGPDTSKTGLSLWVIRNVDLNPDFQPTWLDLDPSQISELAWQPDGKSETVKITPTPEPTQTTSYDGLVAFLSEQSGNQDIYTMRADGSQLTNITNDPADDSLPLWSPDGRRIAFISKRTGNPDIFVMDSDGGNLTQLTDSPGYDGIYAWSPDGGKIIYEVGKEDINKDGQLVLMNSDGSNKTALTDPGSYLFLGWSPDGQKIVYLQQNTETYNPQDDMVVVMNTDGTDRHEWNFIVDRIKWEDDQHFIGDGWNGQVESPDWGWALTRFSANGDPPVEIASHSSRIVEIRKDTHVVAGGSILAWYASDGSPAPFTSWNSAEVCRGVGDQFIPSNWTSTAPDESKALIVIPCLSGKVWFYVNPLDGSPIRKLTDFSLDGVKGGGPEWSWSPDGKYGIMTISSPDNDKEADLFLFDIEQMLKDPAVQPIRITSDKATKYGVVWQPVP